MNQSPCLDNLPDAEGGIPSWGKVQERVLPLPDQWAGAGWRSLCSEGAFPPAGEAGHPRGGVVVRELTSSKINEIHKGKCTRCSADLRRTPVISSKL